MRAPDLAESLVLIWVNKPGFNLGTIALVAPMLVLWASISKMGVVGSPGGSRRPSKRRSG